MKTYHFSVSELVLTLVIYIGAKVILPFPSSLAETGLSASWIIVVIASLLTPLTWPLFGQLLQQHPAQSLAKITVDVLYRPVG